VKYSQQSLTAAVSCDGGIPLAYLSWSKFVNTHLSHSRQWFNIDLALTMAKVMTRVGNTIVTE